MSRDWDTYIYKDPSVHCASWKTRNKYWNLDDPEYKKACIPNIIWNDGHAEWSRWYWFKDDNEHIIRGIYIGFK